MSDPTSKDSKPDNGVDIFSTKPAEAKRDATTGAPNAATGTVTQKASAVSSFLSKLGPKHFIALAVVLAGGWIAWPYVFSGSSSTGSASNSHMLAPDEAMTDAGRAAFASAAQAAPLNVSPASSVADASGVLASAAQGFASGVAAAGTVAPASGAIPASSASAAVVASSAAAQPTSKEAELQAQVDTLQGQLTAAASQAAKCMPASGTTASVASTPKHKARRVAHAPRHYASRSSAMSQSVVVGGVKPADFTLNTVYRDQAWIQNTERTYVVQPGDTIDGMRIVRVEPDARQVVTSLGIIR